VAGPRIGRPGGSEQDDIIRDRRGATRVPMRFPVALRDATHVWKGETLNLSSSGVLIQIPNRLPVGKQLQVELRPERMPLTTLRGEIKHSPGLGVIGIAFDTAAIESFEKAVDLFEGLLAFNPKLAVEVKRRPTQLAKHILLYPIPDCPVSPRPEEAKMLTYFLGGKSLGDVERALGPAFKQLMYLPFSMLDRGLLSTVKPGSFG
jgi:hypothetical protein